MPELNEDILKTASIDKWQRISFKRRAGVLVPLFSLHSKNSLGIGDLEDLKLVIDWAVKTGNSIIELLPLNELGALFCPYESISSFALEPVYLSLSPFSKDKQIKKKIEEIKETLTKDSLYVDYSIKQKKLALLWQIFLKEESFLASEFKDFVEKNDYWLKDFALYKVLKEKHKGLPWYEWDQKYQNRDKQELEKFYKTYEKEITFQMWLQWQLYKQMKEVKTYAQRKKILLKGDLPILVSRDSADVWAHQKYFKLEYAAGAPPDVYCAKGQRWGMPTHNWQNISQDDFKYLKERLKYAQEFYDLLRIDHVVGLFRIWSIPYEEPLENKGLNGFFEPKDERLWEEHGRSILKIMLENTSLLLCAEDLGIIPKVCPKVLKELGIPGNDVQRWMKDWKITHEFLEPKKYRLLSVAMLSTPDTTNWSAWWEYEAGTVDEELFMRKCLDHRQINFNLIKDKLFDLSRSYYGRLRWKEEIDSVDKLVSILNQGVSKANLPEEHLLDFIEIYENSYQEKEKLWRTLKLKGPLREKCDSEIIYQALKITLEANSIFCINTIIDWLYLTDIFKADSYQYRINTPGTVSPKNWSLRLPISLEELLEDKLNKKIYLMIKEAGRI